MESKSTTPANDTSVNSGSKKSEKLQSTISALILAGSGAIIATLGLDVYKTIKNEYTSTMDLRARASELLGAEQTLNELKKYPGASIKFDSKTNRWSVVLPPKNNKRDMKKLHTTQGKPQVLEDPRVILPQNSTSGMWDSFNQKGITGNDEASTATIISNSEHTGIISTEDDYSSFLKRLTAQVSIAMPDFATLKDKIGLNEGTEIKLVQHNDEVWIYGKVQENDTNQKYRLRIAVLDTKNKTINSTILNGFYYLIEN